MVRASYFRQFSKSVFVSSAQFQSSFRHGDPFVGSGNFGEVKIILDDISNNAYFTIIGRETTWTAFGFGSSTMTNADVYVVNKPG